jgi:hypothetical protein
MPREAPVMTATFFSVLFSVLIGVPHRHFCHKTLRPVPVWNVWPIKRSCYPAQMKLVAACSLASAVTDELFREQLSAGVIAAIVHTRDID